MAKKITSKHFAIKRTIEGTNTTVTFVPNIKSHVAPKIIESYIRDCDGLIVHVLDNGREQTDDSYIAMWGKAKGQINWKAKTERINPNPFAIK